MTEDRNDGNGDRDADGVDTGRPIEELAMLEEAPARSFLPRLRRRIARRQLTGQIVELSTTGPFEIFLEFIRMLFGLFTAGTPPKDEEKRDG